MEASSILIIEETLNFRFGSRPNYKKFHQISKRTLENFFITKNNM